MRAQTESELGSLGDADLVAAARAGSQRAFQQLVARYQGLITAMAYAVTGSRTQSEEVAQETFLLAWKRLHSLQQPDRIRGWLCGTVRHRAQKSRRAQRTRLLLASTPLGSHVEAASGEPSALERIISKEEEAVVNRALAAIPEKYRLPLVLVHREQMPIEQVAEALGLSAGNVRLRLLRARRMVRDGVMSLVETALMKTRPTARFTAAVMALIVIAGAGPADAAPRLARVATSGIRKALLGAGAAALIILPLLIRHARHRGEAPPDRGVSRSAMSASLADGLAALRRGLRLSEHTGDHVVLTSLPSPPSNVFAFDFEDNRLPEIFSQGHVVPCAGLRDSRYCLVGTVQPWWGHKNAVTIGDATEPTTLISHAAVTVAGFDFWVGDDCLPTHGVDVNVYDNDKRSNYHYYVSVKRIAFNAWSHAEVRLVDLVPRREGIPQAMDEGDSLRNLYLEGGMVGGMPFLVDNLRITSYPADELPETSTVAAVAATAP